MDLIFKNGLPHQTKGVNAISNVFTKSNFDKNTLYYANPKLYLDKDVLLSSIKNVQKANTIHPEHTSLNAIGDYLNLDIKMETGTGKTYVYTSTIFELHKRHKINKFIVVVPTLPIKAGARQFLSDPYVKKHFKDVCGYNAEIDLQVLESVKKKKGKQFFPSVVREFVSGSSQNTNKIQVLLTNMALLTNSKMLTKNDYDAGVLDFFKPVDAIKATLPFVIIDEPHRFSKQQKAFSFIREQIQPQCIIRYGATFPTKTIGRGKSKKTLKDYQNLVYNLNACDSFNQNLIKGIAKEHFEPISSKEEKVKVMAIDNKTSIRFSHITKNSPNKSYTLGKGDSLSIISEALQGITISAIGSNFFELNNSDKKWQTKEEFSADIYSSSYQEQMLKLAIERHFETEKENFSRRFKIKTLALFFIDDIYSYRKKEDSKKEAYLKDTFEKLLLEKINEVLPKLSKTNDADYIAYLEASKKDISSCHGGYFSQDNNDSDENIANQVNKILHDKKGLLSIKNQDGSQNTLRFLFSKWTLKEGWDNPNVFTITKLRSSGSENSKLQEVGRGLRLPVDENGNRISNEDFKLNYIIDFTEADFADKLINEINDDLPKGFVITEEKLNEVAKKLSLEVDDLYIDLLTKKYIDRKYNIILENTEDFFEEFPDFNIGIDPNKIRDRNKKKDIKIKIRASVYSELKELWEAINQKYLIYYDSLEKGDYLKTQLVKIFENDVFSDVILSSDRQHVITLEDGTMSINESGGVQYIINDKIPYGTFLKRINRLTNLPINILNEALIAFNKAHPEVEMKINEYSIANFVSKFSDWKINNLEGQFTYKKTSLSLKSTALTYSDGTSREEITQGRIGTKFVKGEPTEKYLYDTYAYDSPLEKENILAEGIAEIVVYGKIPRKSLSIPTITGQSYSPDFMYVVKKSNGEKTLNIIVETKDVKTEGTLRKIEKAKINCARAFFEQLTIDGYTVKFEEQIRNKKIKQIIEDVISA
ncbi:type III restriction-modification system endonuclease [uncultured Christiangramia sp.]|uniref:type III restriction-modification system endonuclease n=1 Tax=uncultured Christiangramia sp. TaxID=503836 RepID=UPI002608FF17|nr:type III restriction-modification system endonuclease [uncultured Christiangramia sp.]